MVEGAGLGGGRRGWVRRWLKGLGGGGRGWVRRW